MRLCERGSDIIANCLDEVVEFCHLIIVSPIRDWDEVLYSSD